MSRACRLTALLVLVAQLLAACVTAVPPPPSVSAGPDPQAAWAAVLERFVDAEGRVDFHGLAANRADLDAFVGWVYRVSPASDPALFSDRDAVLAYHINAYNALAMYNVLDSGIPDTLAGLRLIPFFILREIQVGGEPISLYDYENRVIRPLGEERVHFALNCMARGCPRLPMTPFTAGSLDRELDREASEFFAEPRNLQVDEARRVVRVSEILSFFTEDFLAAEPTLIAYVNRYRHPPIPDDYAVEFIPYDWRVNRQPPRDLLPLNAGS
jgi:hypothetical protein